MKKGKIIKVISSIIFITIFTFCVAICMQNEVDAKSYSIENMDIQATVGKDGSLSIEQEITYKFNGSYNGIYINVPYNLQDAQLDEVVKENKINDALYNGNDIKVNEVLVLDKEKETKFTEVNRALNGNDMVYTNTRESGMQKIKIYSPSENTTKTFKVDYIIKNLCVKHNDVGELYYNFIGGAWEVEIKSLNIDIYLPENQEQIYIWGHGPYNGQSKVINNTHANFKVKNIKEGQYVAARVVFDNSNISEATKLSSIDAKDIIFEDENSIVENKKQKNAFTVKIIIYAICLLIYWIILMFIYEKDKKYMVSNIEEDKLFKKYNPMMAGCIQGSRTILARDIIAVILELINKKVIKLKFLNQLEGKDNYQYIISKNEDAESKMDSIEKYIYDWVFENKGGLVNLVDRLKEMPKEKLANKKFKELNNLVEENLAAKGANKAKVPLILRAFNVFLFILSILVVFKHIMFNGFNIYDSQVSYNILAYIGVYILFCIPLIMGILYIPINLIIMLRHKINKTVQRITGQKVATTTISLLVFFGIIILLTAIFSTTKYIIADEILICIATILILTDNLMLKNNAIMIEDYSKLNTLKYKIENYSMMEDKDIEQVTLWERYLSYAVSFGIANKIMNRINGLYIDDDLAKLVNNDMFSNFISSDYYMFYRDASLDRRFAKAYGKATRKMFEGMASSRGGSSSRRRWRFFWWRRLLWRRRKRRRPEVLFSK